MYRSPNIERTGNNTTYWESYWQRAGQLDVSGAPYPLPANEPEWNSKLLILKLKALQNRLDDTQRSIKHDEWTCPLCNKIVSNRSYVYRDMNWDMSLRHQISTHHWRPSHIFQDFLLGASIEIRERGCIILAGREEEESMIITRNQWGILDALMNGGSKRRWITKEDMHKMRYTETAGYLSRNGSKDTHITLGQSEESDPQDKTILFPNDLPQVAEHEFYFHTHPPTPKPGGRVIDGILYEFPSPADVMHFLYQISFGRTKGSIIVAPEGAYILTRDGQKPLTIPEDADKKYFEWIVKIQDKAIAKFNLKGTPSNKSFYNEIAGDHSFAKSLDRRLKKWGLRMHYLSRTKINGKWIIEGGRLPL
jgi:hypothetical protein